MIDLHVHSTYSDGSLSPLQLVREALACGVTALGLVDHDTTDGLRPLLKACREERSDDGRRLTAVPGVEVSTAVPRGTMHLLGYYPDVHRPALQVLLARIRNGRDERNREIMNRLHQLGMALRWEDVAARAGHDVVGRPHFAQAMVAAGYVRSSKAAFEKYLAKGRRAYVDRFHPEPEEAIRVLRDAGAVPVLAHPTSLELGKKGLHDCVARLVAAGLQGLEVYHPDHQASDETHFLALAREFGLVVTGGSDFHGEANPQIRMGLGFGRLRVPETAVDELRARASAPSLPLLSRNLPLA